MTQRARSLAVWMFACLPVLAAESVPLAGEWGFALDPGNAGVTQRWFAGPLPDRIQLPGTTDEARKGKENQTMETAHLTRLFPYSGAAWYQRGIDVSAEWKSKRISLFLERTKTTRLWLDGKEVGEEQNSLVVPHVYALGSLAPGHHLLTLRIDNASHPPIGDPHQISEHTQTNWNGVIGRLALLATDPVWIEDVQVYPNRAARVAKVRIEVENESGAPAQGKVTLHLGRGEGRAAEFSGAGPRFTVESEIALGADVRDWDEFSPAVQRLTVRLSTLKGDRDERSVSFGVRDFAATGARLRVNGRGVFLRGKVDNCVFPLTGYSSMDTDEWLRLFRIAKDYGINHYRFHTWCPPEAAFEAADRLGIYLQPELPNWMGFGEKRHDDFVRAEGERMLRAYGNHPSFVMLSLGNELGGKQELMAPFVKHFREIDGRHLYAQGTNNWFANVYEGDDYWASFQTRNKKIRGSFATVNAPLGHVQIGPPSTMKDYSEEIAGMPVPVISHEIGEYQVAPDFREIEKYTGVLRARNLETFRRNLEKRGLLDQADGFLRASGKLAAICYREDIEAALRTPGFAGFQLLDLQDFPGQGTALVGILNAFMESKGAIEPAAWRKFCDETVPLLRMQKFTWTRGETLVAQAEVAHYGAAALQTTPVWTLRSESGRTLATGRLLEMSVPQGSVTRLGEIRIPAASLPTPAHLVLDLSLEGTRFSNSYDVWLYPDSISTEPGRVLVAQAVDDSTARALAAGASVLLLPGSKAPRNSVEGAFAPDFWNYGMFRKFAEYERRPIAPGTLGVLCDSKHPALAAFPTSFHSDWQWFHLLRASRPLILDSLPAVRPIIRAIDNYERAHSLGVLLEARVGRGRVVICAIDLLGHEQRPEARQLLHSILEYMNSSDAAGAPELSVDALRQLLE